MARGRRRRADAQSIDSLLDTMANVVGILIVLVAVTQLSVGDAVERIVSESGSRAAATPDDLARVVGEQETLDAAAMDVRTRLEAYTVEEREGMLLADADDLIKELESLPGESAAAGDLSSKADLAARRQKLDQLEAEVDESRGEHEQLLAVLKEPARADTPRVIRLPDPRPPPANMERVFIFCRFGQAFVIDQRSLEEVLMKGIADAVGSPPGEVPVVEDTDERWVVNYFDKQWIGYEGYRWLFQPRHREPFVVALTFTDRVAPGDDEAMLLAGKSRVERALDRLSPHRQYIRFIVWPDSYEVYLTARRVAEKKGFRVGWAEMEPDEKLIFSVLASSRPVPHVLD